METNIIYNEDCLKGIKKLPDNSINTCVTSPPYWGLRDYGVEGQLGLENTPEEYVNRLVNIFSEVKRVLRNDGTLWLNLGDSYANNTTSGNKKFGNPEFNKNRPSRENTKTPNKKIPSNLKQKDLIGIPWRIAFALQEDGWYLRSDIIWHKPNPIPESVKDRPTKSHEYIFLLSKSKKYYYDYKSIKEPAPERFAENKTHKYVGVKGHRTKQGMLDIAEKKWHERNKRDVWTVNTKPFPEAHFAVYPPDLIRPCIKAGCPDDGIVLDPFMGAGTTALVALQENKQFIGFELNKEYINIALKRIGKLNKKYYKQLPEKEMPKQIQMF